MKAFARDCAWGLQPCALFSDIKSRERERERERESWSGVQLMMCSAPYVETVGKPMWFSVLPLHRHVLTRQEEKPLDILTPFLPR
jgi:hypothetical protein